MATIEKRIGDDGKTSYRAKVRLKGFPPESATFERISDARKWAQHTESAIREGRYFKTAESRRHTLGELIDRYIKDVLPGKPKSAENQDYQLRWWKAQIGDYTLADVTPSLVVECRDRLLNTPKKDKSKRSPSTVVRYMAALSHVFTIAVKEWGWAESNPFQQVSKPKQPRGRVRFLDDDERGRLLEACKNSKNPSLYIAVVLSLSTGARKMEIMGLRWKQVDLKRRVITLEETKNGERRALPLTGLALKLMKKRSKIRHLGADLVFPGNNSKKPIALRAPWEKALEDAEVGDFRWHDLRHSAASYLAMNGATSGEIAEVLGHKTLQMVKRYAHLSDAHTAGVVGDMNAKIFGGHDVSDRS